jgi:tetratricopeptide (TPR) repeat protein
VLVRVRDIFLGLFVAVIIGGLMVLVYNLERDKEHRELAKRIAVLSPRGGTPRTIEDLKKAITLYENQIELNVKTGVQTGTYWKILAIRLSDKGMNKDAVEAFDRALYYNSSDPTLFYLTGESASIAAASTLHFNADSASEKERYQNLAESAYLRAIELDPTYAKPKLGLGILYTFDMDRPSEALQHLERYQQLVSSDTRSMFVLARAYYMTGDYERAIELYDRIIYRSKDPKLKTEAQNNKEIIQQRDLM